jgi:hypothetical protein
LPGELEEQIRLANQVESDVREGDVFFQDRRVSAPLREAVTEDEAVVGESEEILKEIRVRRYRHAQ